MASSSAKARQSDRDKKVGPETKMEEEGLKIETKTMEGYRWSRREQPHSLKGKRRRQQYKAKWEKNVLVMSHFD